MKIEQLPTYEESLAMDDCGCDTAISDFIRLNEPNEKDSLFREQLVKALTEAEQDLADKILTRCADLFFNYKNHKMYVDAGIVKTIMANIEEITGFKGPELLKENADTDEREQPAH